MVGWLSPFKRCHPDQVERNDLQINLVRDICHHIDVHVSKAMKLNALGGCFHVSPSDLQRVFRDYVGVSPQDYAEATRMNQLKRALRDGA